MNAVSVDRTGAGLAGGPSRRGARGADLARRVAAAAVIAPLAVAAAWAGGHWLAALLSAAALIGAHELAGMFGRLGARPLVPVSLAWSVGMVVALHLHVLGHPLELTAAPVAAAGAALSLATFARRRPGEAWRDCLATAATALAAGGLLGFGVLLRGLENGAGWSVALIAVVAAADIGAYAVGVPYGRRRLAPSMSPGKTWEGAAGGLAAAMGVAVAAAAGFGLGISAAAAVGLGALLWAGALSGDLLESALKRRAGLKDSGRLIPGHGGIFDRLDSLVLSLALCYAFASLAAG